MILVTVTNGKQNLRLEHEGGALEFGRGPRRELPRVVIDDVRVSRDQLRVEEMPGGRVRVENLSLKIEVLLEDGSHVPMGSAREVAMPFRLAVGQTVLALTSPDLPSTVAPDAVAPAGLMALARPACRSSPGLNNVLREEPLRLDQLGDAPSPEMLTGWMETIIALQRSASGPPEFFDQAARALIDLVGLDVGLVLMQYGKDWRVVARAARDDSRMTNGREFSQTLLRLVVTERRTFFQDPKALASSESLCNIDAVVVSPVFGLQDEVAGVLYGSRRSRGGLADGGIKPLQAQVVQLLAAAVGANLSRSEAMRTRTQLEQCFSTELAREMEKDPNLLHGRNTEVTVLMSDLRGFSTLSEQLGPQDTCRLVGDLMERLSERVAQHGGVVVNYLGDGLLAMWNAPRAQENHAALACRAALAMLEELPALNAAWRDVLGGRPLGLGVGINTGPAQVGNTGSKRKFMYGPLGNTVNLASRVEGATKAFGVPVLITGATRALVGDGFATRRLCQVRVVGIKEPVDLFELNGERAEPEWLAFRDNYEQALAQYESRNWFQTCQTLLPLLEAGKQKDVAAVKLMRRTWGCLESPPDPFDPVMELTSK